jgi:hypothetical protein
MIIVDSWFGRTGNNILQLIRAIHYCLIYEHSSLTFQHHPLLNRNCIQFHQFKNITRDTIIDSFFYLKKFNLVDPEPYMMKEYFQKYLAPIFKIKKKNVIEDNDTIHIHFRGGDIFSSNPHKAYVQPPLSYYKNIISHYNNVKLVCEDKTNPCINELLIHENVEYISNTLEKDLEILSSSKNLVIGFGTFGFLLYLMNPNLKHLYIPDFFANELPKGKWGNDINIHIINLPNYIQVGEWKNNKEQQMIMLNYN